MALTEENYRNYDLDWFFLAGDKLCHAASSGGRLPSSFIPLLSEYSSLLQTVASMSSFYDVIINPFVIQLLDGDNNEIGMSIYLTTFKAMASKGFYSFDRKNLQNPESNEYVLVANPAIENEQCRNEYQKRIDLLKDIIPHVDELPNDCNVINLIDHFALKSRNKQ